jgi:hypothetical protein
LCFGLQTSGSIKNYSYVLGGKIRRAGDQILNAINPNAEILKDKNPESPKS